jgi:glutamyl-tRNA synthetase
LVQKHITPEVRVALTEFTEQCASLAWNRVELGALIKRVLETHHMKMPQLAIPLRLIVAGTTQTPAIDAVLEILGRDRVLVLLREF